MLALVNNKMLHIYCNYLYILYIYIKQKKIEKNPTHNYFCNLSDFYYLFGGYFKSDPYRYSYNIFFDFSKL